jgi:N-acetylmuramoyl-L-alanine amidase
LDGPAAHDVTRAGAPVTFRRMTAPPPPAVPRALALPLLLLAGCATAGAPSPAPAPDARAAEAGALPPIPRVEGPLRVRVVYPPANAVVGARDSNFIFGSVGHGGARLTVNGRPVEVKPNGSFLAFLPVPAEPRYELVAALGAEGARVVHPVRLLPPLRPLADTGRLVVDGASLQPSAPATLPAGERVRVSLRAPLNASVRLEEADGRLVPLVPGDGGRWAADVAVERLGPGSRVVATRGADTVRLPLPAIGVAPSEAPAWVRLGEPAAVDSGDRRVPGRPLAGGTYKWFFIPGTIVERTAVVGSEARVRLADGLEVWVGADEARPLPAGAPAPRRVAGNARVVPAAGWADFVVPMAERPPYLVEQEGNTLVLTLYGTTANTDIVNFRGGDSLVRHMTWEQLPGGRARYTLHLSQAPYGHLALWRDGAFVLRVRRAPAVDPRSPLRGLRIAVDPGHPPIGATGPTGLYEATATLAIGERLRAELERRGATVVMTRTTADAVALGDRPIIARRADAHALVSIHLNALPDGVNPFPAHGTGTYYFHPQAAPLARAVQAGMVRRMGLRDLGTYYDNLALARPTWMPAVLCEGAFLMIPEQEAALRTPEFQSRYALGVADGLEAFFRGLAADGAGEP